MQETSSVENNSGKKREEKALELFFQGYNCAQSIAGAFSDVMGISQEAALRLSAGFGGGMSDHKGPCGAVSGMIMIAGAVAGSYPPADLAKKRALYAAANDMKARFREKYGSLLCSELLKKAAILPPPQASPRTAEYYARRPCAHFIAAAAVIVGEWLESRAEVSVPPSELES